MNAEPRIVICMGSSCFARGNRENLEVLERFLEEHDLRARVELAGSRCEDDCREGPNILINGVAHHRIDSESLIDVLNAAFGLGGKG